MNLQKLFELQCQLDAHIEQEHPRQPGEDRLAKKILALQVELGELANCWRGFKYWSYNQEPHTLAYDECPCGTDYGSCDEYGCEDGLLAYNPLLEEFADGFHFLLSIGNDINMNEVYEDEEPKPLYCDIL
jgi:dimeric dUTPase (all-alpha-NTP-PPase superfamily)